MCECLIHKTIVLARHTTKDEKVDARQAMYRCKTHRHWRWWMK